MEKHREFVLAGSRMKQHLSSEHTGGILSLFENMSSEASNTPIYVHANEDETLYIIRGEIRAILGGREEVLKAGDTIFFSRGIPHQLVNESGAPANIFFSALPEDLSAFSKRPVTPLYRVFPSSLRRQRTSNV